VPETCLNRFVDLKELTQQISGELTTQTFKPWYFLRAAGRAKIAAAAARKRWAKVRARARKMAG
jgi:hypothetical protein